MDSSTPIEQTPFVKLLAANDRPTRDKALQSLQSYLSSPLRTLTPLDHLKLQKGLFYSLWLCDRPIPQQNLCAALASLISILPSKQLVPFLRAFWQTMAREWGNVDVLRMEKFLLLVRRYVGSCFERMKSADWDSQIIGEILDVTREIPLNVMDPKIPVGLRFHVIDVWVDELERVGVFGDEESEEEALDEKVLEMLMRPLKELGEGSPNKTVRRKAMEAWGDERLPWVEKVVVEEKETNPDEWGGIED